MAIEDLRQRYLWIAKNSLDFLKEQGFKKKGKKYIKQKGELILEIYPLVPRAWINSDTTYEFEINWRILSLDPSLMEFSIFMGAKKNLSAAFLFGSIVLPKNINKQWDLTNKDPSDFDQKYAEGIQCEIEITVLPLFDRLNSFDDVIHLAEEEERLEREKRKFFPNGVSARLARFYAAKGWKEKALKMCDKDVEETPETARYLAEEDKKKYIKYFNEIKKI